MSLNLFPPRVAIGAFTDADGNSQAVFASPEFTRALSALFVRVGGAHGMGSDDLALLAELNAAPLLVVQTAPESADQSATVAELLKTVHALTVQVELLSAQHQALLARQPDVTEASFAVNYARNWQNDLHDLTLRVETLPDYSAALSQAGATVADDIVTNATMYPVWNASASGKLAPKVSSTKWTFNPSTGLMGVSALSTTGAVTANKGFVVNGPAAVGPVGARELSFEFPNTRYYIGDGTGYSFRFSKRAAGVTTDVVAIDDAGNATVAGSIAAQGVITAQAGLTATGLVTAANGVAVTGPAAVGGAGARELSFEFPNTRFYVGDGTGYSFRFAKRAGAVTTDVVTVDDAGNVTALGRFGCNGKPAQASAASGGTLAGVITALVANGILSS